jgi:Uma2 family endonuclease
VRDIAKSSVRTKRWTRLEYERLIDLGAFGPEERLELIGGQLVVREPQGRPHATGIRLVAAALRTAFGPGWTIEAQLPVALDEESEPEPDIAVLAGGPRNYLAPHQVTPALVVEVALSGLVLDREEKGSLYARAGIRDYWILNLLDNVLEVYREAEPDPGRPYGWRYRSAITLRAGDLVTPLAAPSTRISVAELLL